MRRPGHWLRTAAARVSAKRTMDRIVDPIVADLQTEHDKAVRSGRQWRAAWTRVSGYGAFWKAVCLHALQSAPRSLCDAVAADGWTLGRTLAYSLAAFVGVTLLLSASPLIAFYSRAPRRLVPTLLLLPQTIPISIPMALALGIVCGARASVSRFRGVLLLTLAATLLAFAAMPIVPVANQAFRVALVEEFEVRGITNHSLPKGMTELTLSELAAAIKEYDAGGFPATAHKLRRAYQLRLALPAATFVLGLLALGICDTTTGRVPRVVAIVTALGLYWVILAAAERNTSLPPVVSVWAPNLLLTAISLALFSRSLRRLRQQPDLIA